MTKVSVIIPVESFNENLEKCLEALKKQTFKQACSLRNRGFEVIVVADKFSGRPSAKRNWGAKKARGEILAFLDDDCTPKENWIEVGIKSLTSLPPATLCVAMRAGKLLKGNEERIGAMVGPMITPADSPFLERAAGDLCESPLVFGEESYRNRISTKREVSDYPSANFFMRKDDFLKLGGFDERFWPGEDTKLCLDIVRHGQKILYDPEVVVYHRRRPLFRPFLKQVARYGTQRGRFARIFPQTSRKIGYFLPSLLIFFLAFCLIFWRWGVGMYLVVVFLEGARVGIREKNVLMGLVFVMGVMMTHVVYGISFLRGLSYLSKKI